MNLVNYELVTDLQLEHRVYRRYHASCDLLAEMGFVRQFVYSEMQIPYSLFLLLPVWLLMLVQREVLRRQRPFRISSSYPLLFFPDHGTFALVCGLGIKFYTLFDDGTGLITSTISSRGLTNERLQLYKYIVSHDVEWAWTNHQERLRQFVLSGKHVQGNGRFQTYVTLSQREDLAMTSR